MVYGRADRARRLMGKTDEQIRSTFVADFESLWPEAIAGDYAGDWVQMESAAMMGYEAAAKVRRTHADSLLPTSL
jgi:hypothetical protein